MRVGAILCMACLEDLTGLPHEDLKLHAGLCMTAKRVEEMKNEQADHV